MRANTARSKKACEVAAALVCTLSQNGYGDKAVAPLYLLSSPQLGGSGWGLWEDAEAPSGTTFADGHTELNAPDLF